MIYLYVSIRTPHNPGGNLSSRHIAFQTKMWHSNLGKFRGVVVFDAEKFVFRKVLANWKEEKKCSVESNRDNTSNFTKMYNFKIVHPSRFSSQNLSEQNGHLSIAPKIQNF